jgi:hypothetical protein
MDRSRASRVQSLRPIGAPIIPRRAQSLRVVGQPEEVEGEDKVVLISA